MIDFISRFLSGTTTGHSQVSYIIFFIIFGLFIGAVLRGIRGKIRIPYTPVLLVLGLLVGLFLDSLGFIGETGQVISGIEPSGILLIFIPILIFESSFNADWHIFKHSFYQILLLAGPGVVFSFGMIAMTMKLILGYTDEDLTWTSALMFGSILATTDPVAIVAMLKELGAPHYFNTIIEGESLLNDGSSVVFFTIFSNLAAGREVSVGIGIASFFWLCAGGIILGLAFGFFASLWQERIVKDAVLSITIVVTACYFVFWISETYKINFTSELKIGVSGIIGLCTLGLYMAAFGRTTIPARVEHPLHSVVSWAQYSAETIVFLLTGLLVGQILSEKNSSIVASDWWKMILFYVLLNVIRGILVLLLAPLLNKTGNKLTVKEIFVLSYAGLRGSLGLVLALSVDADNVHFSQRTRQLIMFFTAGTATLTILVNGLTIGPLVNKIKMIKKFPAKEKVLNAFVRELDDLSVKTYQNMKEEGNDVLCDWDVVESITGVAGGIRKVNNQSTAVKAHSSYAVNDEDLKTEARFRLLQVFKQLAWEKYKEARLGAHGANIVEKAINVCLDDPSNRIRIFEFLHEYFMRPKTLEIFTRLSKTPVVGGYFKRLMASHMILIYEVNASIGEIVDELKFYADNMPVKEGIMKEIYKEFVELKKNAEAYQNNLGDRFSGIMRYIMTKHSVTKVLMTQKKFLEDKYTSGEIDEKEYNGLRGKVDKKMQKLHSLIQVKWEPPNFLSLLTTFPLFNVLSQEHLNKIVESSRKIQFKKGQSLFEEGKNFDGIYLIQRGTVEILCQSDYYKKGIGQIISLCNLVMMDNISKLACVASQNVEAHKLSVDILRECMQANKEFEERVYKEAFSLLRLLKPDVAGTLVHLSESSSKALMKEAKLVCFTKDEQISTPNGGFVVEGVVKRKERVYDEYSAIPKGVSSVVASSDGKLLKFNISELMRRQSSVMCIVEKLIE